MARLLILLLLQLSAVTYRPLLPLARYLTSLRKPPVRTARNHNRALSFCFPHKPRKFSKGYLWIAHKRDDRTARQHTFTYIQLPPSLFPWACRSWACPSPAMVAGPFPPPWACPPALYLTLVENLTLNRLDCSRPFFNQSCPSKYSVVPTAISFRSLPMVPFE